MSLINNILEEWGYRVDNGMPNPNNPNHINELSTILTEMGMYEIKDELIRNLTEADEQFTNPILNKKIKYKGSDGKDKEGTVGNLLRLQKDHPGRKAAEAQLPPEDSEERKQISKDLGSQNQAKPTEPKAKDSKEEPTAGDKPKGEPQKNPMFTKDADPAMAARMDTEKQTLDKLAKADKPEQSTELEPVSSDPNSKAKKFKGESSGKDIQTIPMEGGGQIYGTVHRNRKMVDDIINHIKATIPEEKWKDIVFVGEGGSTNDSGELVFHDEMKYAAPKFKQLGAGIDTFDGDELDVHDDQSKLYKRQMEKTGFNQSQVKAGNWASMIGQGEGTDTMSPNDYLDNEGKKFLQDEAVNAGFPPIENWDEPTDRDIDTLYRLSFPEDYGDKETKINDIQVAFNEIRDESIIEKTKQLQSQGKIPITIAGESHVDLVDKMMQKSADPNSDFKPVEPSDVTKEMPKADSAAFSGQSDIDKLTKQERKEISMKIDELNKMTQDAIEKGEKAPNYNLCQVTVPGTNLYCDNNLGIPREDMPQFKGKPQPGTPAADMPVDKNGEVDTEPLFKKMLADKGIKVLDTEIPSDSLKATQSELVGSKVAGMTKALEKDPNHPAITAPIYVSRDGYVVDGHHRWAAVTSAAIKAGKPTDMKVRVIDMDAKDIIPMANKFAEEQGVAAKKADANQEGPKSDIAGVPKVEDEKGTTAETPSGKKLYSVGGGYYSDRPDGEPKFIRTEVVARKAFLEGDEKSFLLIFEAEFSADVEGGEAGRFKEIPEKDRKDAAADIASQETTQSNQQPVNIDRSEFDTKNKNYKDAPNGPTQQEILDDLNKGNLDTITEYQNEVESNREKGIAGAGGPVASEGESKFCHSINNLDEFKNENAEKIQAKTEELRGRALNIEEKRFAISLGLDVKSDEFLRILAEREVFAEVNLEKAMADKDNSVFYKPGKTGFDGKDKPYMEWMRAAYAGGLSTINRLNESKLDTSRPYKVVQSTTELNDAVQSHLEDMVSNSQGADKKYYEHQLKLFKKFKSYHDTFAIGKDKNGRTAIVSISNKKDSEVKDPQNNTTPAQRLRLMQIKFGDDVSDGVSKTIEEGIQKVSNAAAATVKSQAKMKIDDKIVAACESPKMKNYMNVLDGIATDGKHRFSKYIQSKRKDWKNLSTSEKLELMNEYSNSRLYDKDGNSRLIEKEGGTFYKDDNGKEIPIKSLGQAGLPYEPFGKIAIKLGEFGVNEETIAIKQTEKDIVTAVHTEVTQKLFEDDEPNGYHPDKRPNADNGKHTQAYISGVMDAMHLGTYIDLDDEDDDAMLIQMGFNGVKPSMIRNCIAEQSGYSGDLSTPDGKNGLKEHLLKKSRVTPGGEKVSVMNEGKEVELFNDQWRTAGTTQKVASYFGKDIRDCLQSKAKK